MTSQATPAHRAARAPLAVALLAAAAAALPAAAQVPQLPPPPPADVHRPFSLSIGPGATASLTWPGDFTATVTLGFGWAVDDRWTITVAPYWEREHDRFEGELLVYDEISLAVGASHAFAPGWTVSAEIDLGLVENGSGAWLRNPEYGVGVGVSRAFPLAEGWSLVVGPELSWKFSDGEWTIGLNTGVSIEL